MKYYLRLFLFIILTGCFLSLSPSVVVASTSVAVSSATMAKIDITIPPSKPDNRVNKLITFLSKYNSPLSDYAENIIIYSDDYEIPWSLVTAIAGVESGFCKQIPKGSYNCWGWENGASRFKDYRLAIETVTRVLRNNYFNRGMITPEKISRVYAPSSTTWAAKVHYFTYLIEKGSQPLATPPPMALE
jgi:hypothetical protein